MSAYFVTGTDTGVGKTTVAVALLGAARRLGFSTAAVKPAESGCEEHTGELVAADAVRLGAVCCYKLRDPVAPNVAAQREGVEIDLAVIDQAVAAQRESDLLLVEGAGGLMVPLTEQLDMAGLASRLGLPLIVVARDALGTINHTVLTVEAARSRNLGIAGIVLSGTVPGTQSEAQRNATEIRRLLGPEPRILGRLPHAPGADNAALAELGRQHLDVASLIVPRGTSAPSAR